jgi:hypothetical protein
MQVSSLSQRRVIEGVNRRLSMSGQRAMQSHDEIVLDAFAAELTDATYPIALKYGVLGSSLDLQLEIWKTLTELVRRRGHELFAGSGPERAAGASCP